jgi:ATP-dependent DNA helicase RecG
MTFFAQAKHVADWNVRRLSVGRRGIFLGKAGRFGGKWQLTNPQMALFGSGEEDAAQMSLDALRDYYPIYPLTKGVDSWDLQRAVTFALTVLDDPPDLLPESVRERHRIVGVRQAYDWIHAKASRTPTMRWRSRTLSGIRSGGSSSTVRANVTARWRSQESTPLVNG